MVARLGRPDLSAAVGLHNEALPMGTRGRAVINRSILICHLCECCGFIFVNGDVFRQERDGSHEYV